MARKIAFLFVVLLLAAGKAQAAGPSRSGKPQKMGIPSGGKPQRFQVPRITGWETIRIGSQRLKVVKVTDTHVVLEKAVEPPALPPAAISPGYRQNQTASGSRVREANPQDPAEGEGRSKHPTARESAEDLGRAAGTPDAETRIETVYDRGDKESPSPAVDAQASAPPAPGVFRRVLNDFFTRPLLTAQLQWVFQGLVDLEWPTKGGLTPAVREELIRGVRIAEGQELSEVLRFQDVLVHESGRPRRHMVSVIAPSFLELSSRTQRTQTLLAGLRLANLLFSSPAERLSAIQSLLRSFPDHELERIRDDLNSKSPQLFKSPLFTSSFLHPLRFAVSLNVEAAMHPLRESARGATKDRAGWNQFVRALESSLYRYRVAHFLARSALIEGEVEIASKIVRNILGLPGAGQGHGVLDLFREAAELVSPRPLLGPEGYANKIHEEALALMDEIQRAAQERLKKDQGGEATSPPLEAVRPPEQEVASREGTLPAGAPDSWVPSAREEADLTAGGSSGGLRGILRAATGISLYEKWRLKGELKQAIRDLLNFAWLPVKAWHRDPGDRLSKRMGVVEDSPSAHALRFYWPAGVDAPGPSWDIYTPFSAISPAFSALSPLTRSFLVGLRLLDVSGLSASGRGAEVQRLLEKFRPHWGRIREDLEAHAQEVLGEEALEPLRYAVTFDIPRTRVELRNLAGRGEHQAFVDHHARIIGRYLNAVQLGELALWNWKPMEAIRLARLVLGEARDIPSVTEFDGKVARPPLPERFRELLRQNDHNAQAIRQRAERLLRHASMAERAIEEKLAIPIQKGMPPLSSQEWRRMDVLFIYFGNRPIQLLHLFKILGIKPEEKLFSFFLADPRSLVQMKDIKPPYHVGFLVPKEEAKAVKELFSQRFITGWLQFDGTSFARKYPQFLRREGPEGEEGADSSAVVFVASDPDRTEDISMAFQEMGVKVLKRLYYGKTLALMVPAGKRDELVELLHEKGLSYSFRGERRQKKASAIQGATFSEGPSVIAILATDPLTAESLFGEFETMGAKVLKSLNFGKTMAIRIPAHKKDDFVRIFQQKGIKYSFRRQSAIQREKILEGQPPAPQKVLAASETVVGPAPEGKKDPPIQAVKSAQEKRVPPSPENWQSLLEE